VFRRLLSAIHRSDERKPARRGQGMVEFALILPILVVLLVLAVDFGRVFFQWVGVTNATRIAANYAARNPDAWDLTPDLVSQAEYRTLVARDLNPLNCLALNNTEVDASDIPNPTFTGFEIGDQTTAQLQCRFRVLTPVASLIIGGDLFTVTADSTFTVNGGRIEGIPVGVVPSIPPTIPCSQVTVPDLAHRSVEEAEDLWTSKFTGAFTAPPGALPDDEVLTQITAPPSNPGDCVAATTSVEVTVGTATTCAAGEEKVPNLVALTVGAARTKWTDEGFTGAFLAAGADDEVVTSQSVSSGDTAGQCAPLSSLVTVGSDPVVAFCIARQLNGMTKAAAQAEYLDAEFTGNFKSTGPGSGTVTGQKLTGGQPYPCSSDEDVKLSNK
jgi:Flp pilus assembly protein TadG